MEPVWIEECETLALHEHLLALHGGAPGLRDENLLGSALARPRQLYAYGTAPDITQMAAAYTAGILANHPFIDGNKRTGFVIGILFLELNGYSFTASEEDTARAVLALAGGDIKEADYVQFLRENSKSEL